MAEHAHAPWQEYEEEEVFWKGYCEIEQDKSSATSAPSADSVHWAKICVDYFMHLYDPVPDEAEKQFRLHFLEKTKPVAVFTLLFDFFALAVPVIGSPVVYLLYDQGNSSVPDLSRVAWSLQNTTWFLLVSLCLLFYAVLWLDKRAVILNRFGGDAIDILDGISRCILITRALIFMELLFLRAGDMCIDKSILHADDHSFGFVLIHIVVDMTQACAVSLLPLKKSYLVVFCIVEACAQVTRLLSCYPRIGLDSEYNMWVCSLAAPIVAFYVMTIVVPSITLNRSIAASYQHLLRLKDAAEEKKQLVNLFCTDLKVPVQQTKHLLDESDAVKLNAEQFRALDGGLSAITLLVDQALFLIRLHERRFVYQPAEVVSLPSLVEEVLVALVHSNSSNHSCRGSPCWLDKGSFDTDIADTRLFSNKNCLTILIYYSLSAMLLRSAVDQRKIGLSLCVKGSHNNHGNVLGSIYLLRQSDAAEEVKGGAAQSNEGCAAYHYKTCLMFCQHIAKACQGSFSCSPDAIQFSLPCRLHVNESLSTRDEPDCQLTPAVLQQTCIYSADPSLSNFAINALQSITPMQCDPVIAFNQLNMADMFVRSVVVVTSLQACAELRAKGYVDFLVLMTDRLAYLDDKDRMLFDQALAIPYTPQQLNALTKWLNAKVSGNRTPRISLLSNHRFLIKAVAPAQRGEWSIWSLGLVPSLSSESILNYVRWRTLNPSGIVLHHTASIDVMIVCSAVVLLIIYLFEGSERIQTILVVLPFYLIVFLRRIKISKIIALQWSFYYYILLLNVLETIGEVFQIYIQCTNSDNKSYFLPKRIPQISDANTFLESEFANTSTGKHLVATVTLAIITAKVLAEVFIWPFSLFVAFIHVSASVVLLKLYMSTMFHKELMDFLVTALLLVGMFVVGVLIYTENLRRKEFAKVREFILSRDFLERCVAACWRDTKSPLTTLTAIQEAVLRAISKTVVDRQQERIESLLVSDDLLQRMERVNFNVVLSKGLLYEMEMSLRSLSSRNAMSLIASMEDYLLRPIVRRVCSLFLRDDEQLSIKFFLRIHPSMMFVRCNKTMLEAMLFSACRRAAERIEHSVKTDQQQGQCAGQQRCNRGVSHEVMVFLFPGPDQDMLRFTDIHMMHLVVLDTASFAAHKPLFLSTPRRKAGGDQATRYLFVKNTYERYMRQHGQKGAFYSKEDLQHENYQHGQRIALPYKLCPSTPKVASFFDIYQHEMVEKVSKAHLQYQKEYHTEYEERTAMLAKQQQLDRRKSRPLPNPIPLSQELSAFLPFRTLTILASKTQQWGNSRNRGEFARYADCYDSGWDKRLEFLECGEFPALALLRCTYCFVLDHDLFEEGQQSSRRYLEDMVLYLRVHDFAGIIVLAMFDDDIRSDTTILSRASSFGSMDDNSVQLDYAKASIRKEGIDIEVELPLDVEKLLQLRTMCDARLIQLALPSVHN